MILNDITLPEGAERVGWLNPDHSVVLCPKVSLPAVPAERPGLAHLTHAQLRTRYGAGADVVAMIQSFAETFHLELQEISPRRRTLRLRGRAKDVGRAFKTRFTDFECNGERIFAPARAPRMPKEWNGVVEAVLGLHSSGHAWPARASMVHGRGTPASFDHLAKAYGFPPELDGAGETIGLIEFGGGFRLSDVEQFCKRMGSRVPRITVVKVGGGANRPASPLAVHEFLNVVSGTMSLSAKAEQTSSFIEAQSTCEVTMDVEIVAALAPGAHIVVYFASGDEQGLYNAISRAVHDHRRRPSVLSISWSLPEQRIPETELRAIEGVLREAAHLGITVCASSGDAGALNGSAEGKPSVNYPASSPHCLACGGTSGSVDACGIADEVVWNATHYGIRGASGGGVSERFPLPKWQQDAWVPEGPGGVKGRGVPDVAGLADPRHGCELLIAGRVFASAGTSAVAPMWAALIARLNQALGRRCGHVQAQLYSLGRRRATALRPVTKGNNGLYRARKGWNACTGYGTPRGDELLAHLRDRSGH